MCKTINESLDSKEQVRAVFLRLDVNVLVFYRFPKSFNPVASPDSLSFVDTCPSVSLDAASSIFVSNAAAEFSRNSFFIETMELILTHTGRLNFPQLARCGRSCESRYRQPRQGICPFCWYSCELLFLEKCRFEAKTLWIIAEIGVFLVWKNADQYVGKKNIALH